MITLNNDNDYNKPAATSALARRARSASYPPGPLWGSSRLRAAQVRAYDDRA